MDYDGMENTVVSLIERAGYRVHREATATGYRISARDDAGHVHVATGESEYKALVALAESLGFDMLEVSYNWAV